MKKIFSIMLVAAAAAASFSCTKELTPTDKPDTGEVAMKTISVNASIRGVKTTLDSDHERIVWSTYDKISIFNDVTSENAQLTYSAGGKMEVSVPDGTDEIYSVYPYTSAASGPSDVTVSISNTQTQTNPGELAGKYFPMAAKGNLEGDCAMITFYPIAGALAMNIYNSGLSGSETVKSVTVIPEASGFIGEQSGTDLTEDGVMYSDAGSSLPVCVTLTNGLSLGSSKPSDTRAFDGQIYACMAKQDYSGMTFVIETDKNIYTRETDAQFDLMAHDFLPVNIDLANAETMEPTMFEEVTSGAITEGDYLIYADGKAMASVISSNRLYYVAATPDANSCITTDNPAIVWHIAASGDYWTICNSVKRLYAASSGSKNQAALSYESANDKSLWSITGSGSFTIENKYNKAQGLNAVLRQNGTYGFAAYAGTTGNAPVLYRLSTKTLSSIALSGTYQTSFYEGDSFNHDGLVVTAVFSDASELDVTSDAVISTPDLSSTGVKTVTVSYTYRGVEKTTSYDITVLERPVFTVTFADDSSSLTEAESGAGVTLPSRTGDATYTFVGWVGTEITTETTTAPETVYAAGSTYYPSGDTTLYPVYSRTAASTKWVLTALDSVTEGTYILINDQNYVFNGGLTNNNGGHGTNTATTISFTNGEATSIPDGSCQLAFTAVTGGFTLYNEDHGYLYAKAASSGNLHWHATESSYWCYKNNNWSYNANNARLRGYNNATSGFRTYNADNGTLLKLAKQTASSATYYISNPS